MSRTLIVRLKGGLGNQLFSYATARRLALVNKAELVLDIVTGFKYDHVYHRSYAMGGFSIPARLATPKERMEPMGRIRRLIARKYEGLKPMAHRRYIQQVGVKFDPEIIDLCLQNGTTYFDAFGQSERYFADISHQLQLDLEMAAPIDNVNQQFAKEIKEKKSVALHVRWFDDGTTNNSPNISIEYYAKAIKDVLVKIEHAHFFIFSDQPVRAAEVLAPLIQGMPFTLVSHNIRSQNDDADFWLMRQCKHFIIGNSTFAWWAAWLGERRHVNAKIYAPAKNLGPEQYVTAWGFPGLLPERWTAL